MKETLNTNTPTIEGLVTIEKFDESGNLIYSESGKNTIKQWVYDCMKKKMMSAATAWNPRQTYEQGWDSYNPVDWFRYIYLVNSADVGMDNTIINSTSEPYFPLKSGNYIGWLDRYNQTVGSDVKLGIINYEESYCTPTSAKFVYQWGTSKAVGTFDSVIHAQLSTDRINNIGSVNYNYGEKTVSVAVGTNQSVWKYNRPSTFCPFKNESNQLVIAHSPVLVGDDLQVTEFNTVTGITTNVLIDSWANAWSGSAPERMACIVDSGVKTYLFTSLSLGSTTCTICKLTAGVWSKSSFSTHNYYGANIDATYVYMNHDALIKRYLHNGTAAGTHVITPAFLSKIGNKFYCEHEAKYYDITNAAWNGSTLTPINCKYSYHNFGTNGHMTVDGEFYWFHSHVAYVTGENNGYQSTTYSLVKCPIESYRCTESANYRHGTTISKGENETLKITYTFNFT